MGTTGKKVRDVMHKDLKTIGRDASLLDAAKEMAKTGTGSLVVEAKAPGSPVGIITRKDIVGAYSKGTKGKNLKEVKVGEVAATPMMIVSPGTEIHHAARIMAKANVRRLGVYDGDKIVGIISNSDILKAIAAHYK